MGGGHNRFGANLDAIKKAEQGVRDATNELSEMAGWIGKSVEAGEKGWGLQHALDLGSDVTGHDELASELHGFCEDWEWGIDRLVEDGVGAADALGEVRDEYTNADQKAATDMIKSTAHFFLGNPMEKHSAWNDKSAQEIIISAGPAMGTDLTEQQVGRDLDGDGTVGGGG